MDPRTAYFRCHELRYEDFGSVQALLESMREYQRIAPEELSDTNLESVLWNKVPYTLQREVGGLKDWALQELFQRLLKAEARVQERERRQQIGAPTQSSSTMNKKSVPLIEEKGVVLPQPGRTHQPNPRPPGSTLRGRFLRDRSNVEMTNKNVTCFNCREKGHMAASCPKAPTPKNVRMVTSQPEKERQSCGLECSH